MEGLGFRVLHFADHCKTRFSTFETDSDGYITHQQPYHNYRFQPQSKTLHQLKVSPRTHVISQTEYCRISPPHRSRTHTTLPFQSKEHRLDGSKDGGGGGTSSLALTSASAWGILSSRR